MSFLNFGKKDPGVQQKPVIKSGPPTDRVLQMRQQGMQNSKIVETLQHEGYEMTDIFDAMNQSEMKTGVGMGPMSPPSSSPNQQQPMNQNQMPPSMQSKPFPGDNIQSVVSEQPPMQEPNFEYTQEAPLQASGSNPGLERIEELAEAIIDEKWNEIVKSINKIIDWKDRTESRIIKLEQGLQNLDKQFDSLHKGVLGKIGEYDKNLTTIGSEIKAMDKVFSKVLPVMTENINELGRITQDLKKQGPNL